MSQISEEAGQGRAPVVLFVYNRPWHTKKTLDALASNEGASDTTLYVYSDGWKENADQQQRNRVLAVREIIAKEDRFREVIIIENQNNRGLADSIVGGVTEVVGKHGKVIVLEDDVVTTVGFLKYMNESLELYEDEERVMHVSAFIYPIEYKKSSTFFYNVNSCWGWGTWQRAWKHLDVDAGTLQKKLGSDYSKFNFNGGQLNLFSQQLAGNLEGTIRTWAVKWHTSIFLKKGLCVHPHKSLVVNIGNDGTGEHCTVGPAYGLENQVDYVEVSKLDTCQSRRMHKIISKKVYHYFQHPMAKFEFSFDRPFAWFKKIVKSFIKVNTRAYREQTRLKNMPRHLHTYTTFLGTKVKIVDALTYMEGVDEIFNGHVYKFVKSGDKPPVILDCGANIGLSTIYFKRQFPDAVIRSFEPDPYICEALRFNVGSFGFKNVEVNQAAIWTQSGKISFHQEGGFSGRIPYEGDSNLVEVDCVGMNELIANSEIDFLKLDIEGAEYEVLKSCKDNLRNVRNLFIEYHSHIDSPQKLHEILDILGVAGFRYHIKEAFTRKHPFVEENTMMGMDLQLNIFAVRDHAAE